MYLKRIKRSYLLPWFLSILRACLFSLTSGSFTLQRAHWVVRDSKYWNIKALNLARVPRDKCKTTWCGTCCVDRQSKTSMSAHQHAARRQVPLTGHRHTQPHALHHLRRVRCGGVTLVGSRTFKGVDGGLNAGCFMFILKPGFHFLTFIMR